MTVTNPAAAALENKKIFIIGNDTTPTNLFDREIVLYQAGATLIYPKVNVGAHELNGEYAQWVARVIFVISADPDTRPAAIFVHNPDILIENKAGKELESAFKQSPIMTLADALKPLRIPIIVEDVTPDYSDFEPIEKEIMPKAGVQFFSSDDVDKLGLDNIISKAIANIANKGRSYS